MHYFKTEGDGGWRAYNLNLVDLGGGKTAALPLKKGPTIDPNGWHIRIYCFLSPRLSGGPGPPYLINYTLSPYDSYVTQLHFFSEFETSPPPLKLTFCTEFALE